jgi:hypothetical protein
MGIFGLSVKQWGAVLTLAIFANVFIATEAKAALFGAPIMTNVDTQSQSTQIVIPIESLEPDSTFGNNVVYSLFSDLDSRSLNLTCTSGIESVVCTAPTNNLVSFLNPISNWGLGETHDLAILGKVSGNTEFRWPALFLKIDNFIPKTLEYTDSTSGAFLIGVDLDEVSVSARILNRTGVEIPGEITLLIEGEPVTSSYTDGARVVLIYSAELLQDGLNNLQIRSTSEYGELTRSFAIEKYTPQITDITLDLPTIFYPIRDGYQDTIDLNLGINTPSGRSIPGTGTVVITNSAKTKLATWTLKSSGSQTLTYTGLYKKKPVSGSLYITVSFAVNGGNKLTKSVKISASTKKLTDVSKSILLPAWSAIVSCGPFEYSCNHYAGTSTSSGVELYNESFDRNHESIFRLPVPTSAFKWRVTLNSFVSGSRSASYSLYSVTDDFSTDSGNYLGRTTTRTRWKGAVTSAYSTQINETGSYLKMISPSWGSIYFKSLTVTYVSKVLK